METEWRTIGKKSKGCFLLHRKRQ